MAKVTKKKAVKKKIVRAGAVAKKAGIRAMKSKTKTKFKTKAKVRKVKRKPTVSRNTNDEIQA